MALLVDMAKHAGLPWDMVFGADLFGHYKPDPETYLGACRLLGLAPGPGDDGGGPQRRPARRPAAAA